METDIDFRVLAKLDQTTRRYNSLRRFSLLCVVVIIIQMLLLIAAGFKLHS